MVPIPPKTRSGLHRTAACCLPLQSPASGSSGPLPCRLGRCGQANTAGSNATAATDSRSALISPDAQSTNFEPSTNWESKVLTRRRRCHAGLLPPAACGVRDRGPMLLLAAVQAPMSGCPGRTPRVLVPLAPPRGRGAGAPGSALSLPTDGAAGCTKAPLCFPGPPELTCFFPPLRRFFSL